MGSGAWRNGRATSPWKSPIRAIMVNTYPVMRYRFYTTSTQAWGAMLASIGAARESIYLEMYIFHHDTAGYDFLSELERKAREGVRVVVILDAFGSFGFTSIMVDRLKNVGAEVLFFSYWFRRTHRKILIVDETVAFLGGVNISNYSARWSDLQLRITGKRAVRHILYSFSRVYHECGGKNPALRGRGRPRFFGRARLWFIEHGMEGRRTALKRYYREHIDNAARSVVLVTPYFMPRHWLIAAIHRAIVRGVSVEILVPKITDYKIIDRINHYYFDLFTRLGAICYVGGEMNHAKAMLIDARTGTVGSQNIDAQSFNWNVESGVFFDDPKMVRDLMRIIETWKKGATLYDAKEHTPRWHDKIFAFFLRIFEPVL